MRILALHPVIRSHRISSHAGGMARVAYQLTEGLLSAGEEVAILPIPERLAFDWDLELSSRQSVHVFPPMDLPEGREAMPILSALIRQTPPTIGWYTLVYRLMFLSGLRRAILRFRPDVLHNHHATSPFVEMYCALKIRVPSILTHHHWETGQKLDAYHLVIFPSESARIRSGGLQPEILPRSRVIFNPVDEVFRRMDTNPRTARKGILFVGVVTRRKGIHFLLQAYSSLPLLQKQPLTVCGEGDALEESRHFAERHALPVTFTGWKRSEEIRQLMRSSLALVLPSRQESFGVALAEAVCCGTPVIGWADTVREMSAALEMPVGEALESDADRPELLAEKILRVVESKAFDPDVREQMAARARDLFSLERYVEQNRSLYRKLV